MDPTLDELLKASIALIEDVGIAGPVSGGTDDGRSVDECVFCGGRCTTIEQDQERLADWRLRHEDDCLWVKFVDIVAVLSRS